MVLSFKQSLLYYYSKSSDGLGFHGLDRVIYNNHDKSQIWFGP